MTDRLVCIVHPYVYKLQGDTLVIGPIPEFEERDRKVANFIETALEHKARVLHERAWRSDDLKGAMQDLGFIEQPFYRFLKDERIDTCVTTTFGGPIDNTKPKKISEEDWEFLRSYYTSEEELGKKIGNPDVSLYIGGVIEACLANAMGFHERNYKKEGQIINYVEELCVCADESKREEAKGLLAKRGIIPVSLEEALGMLKP